MFANIFWPPPKGGVLAVFYIWHSTCSHGLLYLQYLKVSQLLGLPWNCMTGFEDRVCVVRVFLSSLHYVLL